MSPGNSIASKYSGERPTSSASCASAEPLTDAPGPTFSGMVAHSETLAPPPDRAFEALLSFEETRGIFGCSRATLYRLLARGDLHAVKVGGRLKFQPGELRDFFDRERVGACVRSESGP